MCKSLGLLILNGRKIGDIFGAYTSFQWNGNSVVDYVLTSHSLYHSINYFKVGKFIPWLSDHCALRYRLDSCLEHDYNSEQKKPDLKFETLFWNEESPEKFISILRLHEQEIEAILNSPDTHGKEIVDNFQCLIKNAVHEGNFKKICKKPSTDAPWFDECCQKCKEDVTTIGKSLQNDLELRKSLSENKKRFRKLIREKKRSYAKGIFDNMMQFNS